ncbi:MAG: hypothetical protein JSS66_05345 [Armatimonadetes bacterium]|nr:hypothetical protein [Armatimonadota bacterium]
MPEQLDFEEAKRQVASAEKALAEAEATASVVGRQLEALKLKRSECERKCKEACGVTIDQLEPHIAKLRQEYTEKVAKVTTQLQATLGGANADTD